MPLWDYKCPKCGLVKEVLEKASENITRQCMPCNVIMEKQASVGNFQFRGAGFYTNDYPKKT